MRVRRGTESSRITPSPAKAPQSEAEHVDVLVIGAGQAGLALGWHLRERGVTNYLVVDAGPQIGHVWRSRWDSLRLFTPAEYDALPGKPFPAPAGSYPTKDHVADYLSDYASTFDLPVRLNTSVTKLTKCDDTFVAETSTGTVTARRVAVATGPFQKPLVPAASAGLANDVTQLHSAAYRDPARLPDGPVLVVGAANSGLQIAAELATTRPVTVSVGSRPPMLPQRFLGRDLFWWLTRLGAFSTTADSPIARRMRKKGDLVIGTRPRDLARLNIRMRPRVTSARGHEVTFADGTTDDYRTVLWATGFRSDYSWLDVPDVISDGSVVQTRGITNEPGLAFLGLPWQHTRGSALLGFVGDDAGWLAENWLRHEVAGRNTRAASSA